MEKIDDTLCIDSKDFDKIMEEKWGDEMSPTDRLLLGVIGIASDEHGMIAKDIRKIKKVIIEPIWESENDG